MPRFRMISIAPLVAFITAAVTFANDVDRTPKQSDPKRSKAEAPASQTSKSANLDRLLDEWERQSAMLKTLEFSIYRIDRDQTAKEVHYEGQAAFKYPNFAYLDYRKIKLIPDEKKKMVPQLDTAKKRVSTPLETFVWTSGEVWQYSYDAKLIFIYNPDEHRPPSSLGNAPFPLTFNVRAVETRNRYDLELIEQKPNECFLKITPKREKDRAGFSKAFYLLDAKYLLPKRILLVFPDNRHTQDLTLSHFQINQPVNESFFRGVAPGKPWKIERVRNVSPRSHMPVGPQKSIARQPAEAQASRPKASESDQPR